jgi:hypothetical protein
MLIQLYKQIMYYYDYFTHPCIQYSNFIFYIQLKIDKLIIKLFMKHKNKVLPQFYV